MDHTKGPVLLTWTSSETNRGQIRRAVTRCEVSANWVISIAVRIGGSRDRNTYKVDGKKVVGCGGFS
jgi:hypothetical protein